MAARVSVAPTELDITFPNTLAAVERHVEVTNRGDAVFKLRAPAPAVFEGSETDPFLVGAYGGFGPHPVAETLNVPVECAEIEDEPELRPGQSRRLTLLLRAPDNWNPDLTYTGRLEIAGVTVTVRLNSA